MQHAMIDCETLSLDPNAVVFSIGVVLFDPGSLQMSGCFEQHLSMEQQIDKGRSVSASTLQWWMRQSEGARAPMTSGGAGVIETMEELRSALHQADAVWASAADKDFVWINSLCRDFRVNAAWSYKAQRCFRTLREVFDPHYELSPPQFGESHRASDDAIFQFQHLKNIVERHRINLAL